ncbi:hypothetical protein QOT17_000462 [Balamuthia mandrillaris]
MNPKTGLALLEIAEDTNLEDINWMRLGSLSQASKNPQWQNIVQQPGKLQVTAYSSTGGLEKCIESHTRRQITFGRANFGGGTGLGQCCGLSNCSVFPLGITCVSDTGLHLACPEGLKIALSAEIACHMQAKEEEEDAALLDAGSDHADVELRFQDARNSCLAGGTQGVIWQFKRKVKRTRRLFSFLQVTDYQREWSSHCQPKQDNVLL